MASASLDDNTEIFEHLREDSRATLGRGVYESVRVLMENHPAPCRVSLLSNCSLQQPRAQWALHEAERQVKVFNCGLGHRTCVFSHNSQPRLDVGYTPT